MSGSNPFKLIDLSSAPDARALDIASQTYHLPLPVVLHIEDLHNAWEGAEARTQYLANELRWFCSRVESGEIHSVDTYASFKHALMVLNQAELPKVEPPDEREQVARENRVGMASFAVGLLLGIVGTVMVAGWL